MLCDSCGKNPAKVHYKEVKDNKATEYHLCEACAAEKGIEVMPKKQPFSISAMLAGMADDVGSDTVKCQTCGLTYKDFCEAGRLGCSECYTAFKEQLTPLLRRIHGSNVHVGKSPHSTEGAVEKLREIESLKLELRRAIDREEFEKAAEVRDRLKELGAA